MEVDGQVHLLLYSFLYGQHAKADHLHVCVCVCVCVCWMHT